MNAMSSQVLDLPGHRVGYTESAGSSETTPLVLLHGGGVDGRMWRPQLSAFPGRRVVAPDARAHGASSDAPAPYRLADDVVDLLDALGIERAVLAGISMGGGTAVDVALEHPARVAGLVVSGTGTSEPEFSDPWVLETFTAWKGAEARGDTEAWIEAFMRFTHGPYRGPQDIDPAVWSLIESMVRDTLAHHVPVGDDGVPLPPVSPVPVTDTWARLGEIEVPVLAVPGALDSADHRDPGRRLAEAVPRGEYQEITGSAHYPNLENPADFDAAVAGFLDRHGF
jgi:pimeloyl-ACP methyl ester carboxylesterase